MHNARFRQKDWKQLTSLKAKSLHILEKIQHHIPVKTYKVTQSDFEKGTFRITHPGKYVLQEDYKLILFGIMPSTFFTVPVGNRTSIS